MLHEDGNMIGTLLYTPYVRMEPSTVERAGIDVFATAQFSAQVLDLLSNSPHIALLITDRADTTFIEEVLAAFPELAILVIAPRATVRDAVRVMLAGAIGYMAVEDVNTESLAGVVTRAHAHRQDYMTRAIQLNQALEIIAQLSGATRPRYANGPPLATHTLPTPTHTRLQHGGHRLNVRGVELDEHLQEVTFRGQATDLSPTEYEILHVLMKANGQLVSFVDLAEAVHGAEVDQAQARSLLSAHISNLRNKLRDVGCDNYIVNRRGRGYFIDVDMESALERGHTELRFILEATNDIILQADADATITYISSSVHRMLGYQPDQIIGTTVDDWLRTVHETDQQEFERFTSALVEGQPVEGRYRVRHRAGHYIWVENIASPLMIDGQIAGIVMVIRDVTERVEALELLRQSEERLRLLLQNIPDLIVTVDQDGVVQYANVPTEPIAYFGTHALMGRNLGAFFDGDALTHFEHNIARAYQDAHYFEHDVHLFDEHDREVWLHVRYCPVLNSALSVSEVMLIIVDVTQQRAALESIQANAERYRILAEHMTDLVTMHDVEAHFMYISPSSERLLGYTPQELVGKAIYGLMHPKDVTEFRKTVHEPALAGQRVENHVYRMRRKSGEYIWIETSVQPVIDAENHTIRLVATSRDMTFRTHIQPGKAATTGHDVRH